ncbi:MAG: hypothetical protein ACRELY_26215 [Polyangiaceae bacterium]
MYRTASVEDVYAGTEGEESGVASRRRVTIPVGRPKHLTIRDETATTNLAEKTELTAAAVRAGDVVPNQSMRRIKVAKPVAGVPQIIQEQISVRCLRDPRRD